MDEIFKIIVAIVVAVISYIVATKYGIWCGTAVFVISYAILKNCFD